MKFNIRLCLLTSFQYYMRFRYKEITPYPKEKLFQCAILSFLNPGFNQTTARELKLKNLISIKRKKSYLRQNN